MEAGQGDEKDIILYSPVYPKSNLWNDKNLLNVAVSRAKSTFYIFGDKDSIYKAKDEKGINLMKELIDYIDVISKQKEIIKINKFDTEYEKIFFEELKKANIKFDFHSIENNGKYELDFKLKLKGFNKYLNIELDGNSHDNKKSYDYTRNKIVAKLGHIKVIRYTNKYLIENIYEIIESLKKICELKN